MTALHAAYYSFKFNFFRPFRILAISTSKHRSVNSFSESTITLCASSSSHTQGTQALFHPRWLTDERNRTLSSSPQCQSKFDVALRHRRRVSRRPFFEPPQCFRAISQLLNAENVEPPIPPGTKLLCGVRSLFTSFLHTLEFGLNIWRVR